MKDQNPKKPKKMEIAAEARSMPQQGEGCTYELYHNDYSTHPEKKHIVDICIPVKPL